MRPLNGVIVQGAVRDTFHFAILTSACESGLRCGKEFLAFAQNLREK